jgi:hypothetical protein
MPTRRQKLRRRLGWPAVLAVLVAIGDLLVAAFFRLLCAVGEYEEEGCDVTPSILPLVGAAVIAACIALALTGLRWALWVGIACGVVLALAPFF